MRYFTILILILISGCSTYSHHKTERFTDIQSDLVVTDTNHYDCQKPTLAAIKRILSNGEAVSQRELHDHYSTTGCSVEGSLKDKGTLKTFSFDFGGMIYLSDGTVIACGEDCCGDTDFPYCSFDTLP